MAAPDPFTEDQCWNEILKRVEDPADLKSCYETCLTFQEILQERKNAFMFDLILKTRIGGKGAGDIILRYLTDLFQQYQSLNKCRLVCKSWCKTMDDLVEFGDEDAYVRAFLFNSGERTERFLKLFANHNGNPFYGRIVTLQHRAPLLGVNAQGELGETFHMRKLRQLVERFGSKMENVRFDQISTEELSFCKNIPTVLGHLPNLRSLRLGVFNREVENVDLDFQQGEIEMAELATYLAANPLPDLPLLEDLEASRVNVVMMRSILEKYAPTLSLDLIIDNPTEFPEQGLQMSNLRNLSFNRLDASTTLHGLRQLEAQQLKSLDLTVTSNRNQVGLWATDELFRNIGQLRIERLDIDIRVRDVFVGESGPIPAELRPHHDSISEIFLTYSRRSISLNFLLYCPNLGSLYMTCGRAQEGGPVGRPDGVEEILDVNELMEQDVYDLYQSNIWECLPNLDYLKARNNSIEDNDNEENYYRVTYEERILENGRDEDANE